VRSRRRQVGSTSRCEAAHQSEVPPSPWTGERPRGPCRQMGEIEGEKVEIASPRMNLKMPSKRWRRSGNNRQAAEGWWTRTFAPRRPEALARTRSRRSPSCPTDVRRRCNPPTRRGGLQGVPEATARPWTSGDDPYLLLTKDERAQADLYTRYDSLDRRQPPTGGVKNVPGWQQDIDEILRYIAEGASTLLHCAQCRTGGHAKDLNCPRARASLRMEPEESGGAQGPPAGRLQLPDQGRPVRPSYSCSD
jgi:hypothetical protein